MAAGLIDFLDPQAIELQSEAKTNEEIIRILAGKLEKLCYVKPSYADAVVSRELTMPTGVLFEREQNVVALHPDPEHSTQAGISIATLNSPIDFATMEHSQKAASSVFVFLLPFHNIDNLFDTIH